MENKLINAIENTFYVIHIKNTTDQKLFQVNLLELDYEKLNNIKYSSGVNSYTYGNILYDFKRGNVKINKIIIITFCDYHKFKIKQLLSPIDFLTNNIQEKRIHSSLSTKLYPKINPFQIQENVIIIPVDFDLSIDHEANIPNSNLIFEYLMPETEIIIYLSTVKSL